MIGFPINGEIGTKTVKTKTNAKYCKLIYFTVDNIVKTFTVLNIEIQRKDKCAETQKMTDSNSNDDWQLESNRNKQTRDRMTTRHSSCDNAMPMTRWMKITAESLHQWAYKLVIESYPKVIWVHSLSQKYKCKLNEWWSDQMRFDWMHIDWRYYQIEIYCVGSQVHSNHNTQKNKKQNNNHNRSACNWPCGKALHCFPLTLSLSITHSLFAKRRCSFNSVRIIRTRWSSWDGIMRVVHRNRELAITSSRGRRVRSRNRWCPLTWDASCIRNYRVLFVDCQWSGRFRWARHRLHLWLLLHRDHFRLFRHHHFWLLFHHFWFLRSPISRSGGCRRRCFLLLLLRYRGNASLRERDVLNLFIAARYPINVQLIILSPLLIQGVKQDDHIAVIIVLAITLLNQHG